MYAISQPLETSIQDTTTTNCSTTAWNKKLTDKLLDGKKSKENLIFMSEKELRGVINYHPFQNPSPLDFVSPARFWGYCGLSWLVG